MNTLSREKQLRMYISVILGFVAINLSRPVLCTDEQNGNVSLTTFLSNGVAFPLVGIGVGNLPAERLEPVLLGAIAHTEAGQSILIDTAKASNNEQIVAQITLEHAGTVPVHVVTKVWYTHLGYNRTRLSIQESVRDLNGVKIHMLLHWPRCDNTISWMDCKGDEADLPQYVRDAGPPPHLDPANAWRESWRALEDAYNAGMLTSIGVSNFSLEDLAELLRTCRIRPHILQDNVWSYLHDPHLMKLVTDNGILFQAYNVMNGIVQRQQESPNAYQAIWDIGQSLSTPNRAPFDVAQIVLAWLVQSNVAVIPRTSQLGHLEADSASSLQHIPQLTTERHAIIRRAARALMQGRDLPSSTLLRHQNVVEEDKVPDHVLATFAHAGNDSEIHLAWSNTETGEEIPVKSGLRRGETFRTTTYSGHVFVAYGGVDRETRREYTIQVESGGHEHFALEL